MSLIERIEAQGEKLAKAEHATKAALEDLHQANFNLRAQVEERTRAEERLRILCDTMVRPDLSFSERVNVMLRSTCQNFDLEAGVVARIENGLYTIIYSWSETALDFILPGTVHDYKNTYCEQLDLESKGPVGIEHMGETALKDSAIYLKHPVETYFGSCVKIQQKFWGALCFFDTTPRQKAFIQPDYDFLRLISQWIGTELSLQQERLVP